MKWKLAALLILCAWVIPAKAQTAYNCSSIGGELVRRDVTTRNLGTSSQPDIFILSDTDYYYVTCTNLNTGATYLPNVTSILAAGAGSGMFSTTDQFLACNPRMAAYPNVPTSYGGSNEFTVAATDNIAYQAGTLTPKLYCRDGDTHTSTTFCRTIACSVKQGNSPIIVDVSGNGFFLTDANDGVMFDISGTGKPIKMGWTAATAQNAFLALPGPDGLVHSGKELFGNFTAQPCTENKNGFCALAVYDDNHDGVIDARDAVWKSLRLWIDENHDGISQPEELHTLYELGVTSISLKYHEDPWHDQYGNAFRYWARVNDDTKDKRTFDVFFVGLCK
jgi:hypothetical protein